MASIEQVPGVLDIDRTIQGEAFAFTVIFDDDLHLDTFTAAINNGGVSVPLTTTLQVVTVLTTTTTEVTITLDAPTAATLRESVLSWRLTQTSSGVAHCILAGKWGVAKCQ